MKVKPASCSAPWEARPRAKGSLGIKPLRRATSREYAEVFQGYAVRNVRPMPGMKAP